MSVIQILHEKIANQIAAGEVVEGPASAIKELVENALDAGADVIDIALTDAGLSRIVVSDNGEGMSPEDAVLCFSRHATSKIKALDDLEGIATFGFRGEALAAIASVSKVSLVTRRKEDAQATQVCLEGGVITHVGPTAGPLGTRIEVESLFFNTPARLKFLKAQKSEGAVIERVVQDLALAESGVAFSLRHQSQLKLDVQKLDRSLSLEDPRRIERILSLLGDECRGHLFAFDATLAELRIQGYLASPLVSRRDTKGIHLFVNGRLIQDRSLSQAVQIAYRTLLEIGRKPICVLDLQLDPRLVDVNVHPQKAEVRFSQSLSMQSMVISALQRFLATTPWLSRPAAKRFVLTTLPAAADMTAEAHPSVTNPTPLSFVMPAQADVHPSAPEFPAQQIAMAIDKRRFFHELKVLGQIDQTYLVLDDGDHLVLVDQHAAHERVTFEALRQKYAQNAIKGQPLLFPKQISLNEAELQALSEQQDFLSRFGFDVSCFGDNVAIMRAIPPELSENEAQEMLQAFLAKAATQRVSTSLSDWIDKICAQMACHGSIRAGQVLSAEQIQALLVQLDAIDYNAHCPHGRPTTKVISYAELGKWFHRS